MIPAIQPFSHSLFCGSFRFVVIMNGNVPAVRHKSFFFVFPSQIISQELCSGATLPNRTHELVSSTSEKKRRKSHSTRGGGEIRKGKRKFSRFFLLLFRETYPIALQVSFADFKKCDRKKISPGRARARVRGGNCVIGKRASLWRRLHRPCPAARAGRRRWEKTVEGNVHKASTAGPSTFCVFHGAI